MFHCTSTACEICLLVLIEIEKCLFSCLRKRLKDFPFHFNCNKFGNLEYTAHDLQTCHSESNSALVILGVMAAITKDPLQGCVLYKPGEETAPTVRDLPSKNKNK